MPIQGWFTTHVYYENLNKTSSAKFNRDLAEECLKIRRFDKAGQKWSKSNYLGGYTSYSSMSTLHTFSSTFGVLEKKISQHVRKYAEFLEMDLKGRRLEMTDCWLNIMSHQTVHGSHIHPLSTISGTYYVQTPKGCSSIKFEDPRLANFMAAPPRKTGASSKNKQFVEYKAEAGKVVLFESWLRHEVAANASREERISVSFNYNWF